MESFYSKESGYSRRLWPYVVFSSGFFAMISGSRWMNGVGYPPTTLSMMLIQTFIFGPLLGLLAWAVVRGVQKLRGR